MKFLLNITLELLFGLMDDSVLSQTLMYLTLFLSQPEPYAWLWDTLLIWQARFFCLILLAQIWSKISIPKLIQKAVPSVPITEQLQTLVLIPKGLTSNFQSLLLSLVSPFCSHSVTMSKVSHYSQPPMKHLLCTWCSKRDCTSLKMCKWRLLFCPQLPRPQ